MRTLRNAIDFLHFPPLAVADLIFLILLFRILIVGNTALLNDPGTPWHIQVGYDVLATGVPEVDSYSFTRDSEHWISQHWLADTVFAGVFTRWDWNGLVLMSALVLAWTYRYLFRSLIGTGSSLVWASIFTLLAASCGASNWLARPHLISSLFVLITFVACLSYHRGGGKLLYAIPLLMIPWANVHGGFIAGLVVLGCSVLGQFLTSWDCPESRRRAYGFASIFGLSCLATLLNPYGVHLHIHLIDILFTSNVRDLIVEWRAPDLQASQATPLKILLLLSVMVLSLGRSRPNLFLFTHFFVWLYFGLNAIRQTGLAAVIMVIVLGIVSQGFWGDLLRRFRKTGWMIRMRYISRRILTLTQDERQQVFPYWSVMASLVLVLGTILGVQINAIGFGTAHLPGERWPLAALVTLNRQPVDGAMFHDLDWGGFLMLSTEPKRRVFIDDRFELYDRDFVLQYQDAMACGESWPQLCDVYQFRYALIRPWSALAKQLREEAGWTVLHEDESAILFMHEDQSVARSIDQGKGQVDEI